MAPDSRMQKRPRAVEELLTTDADMGTETIDLEALVADGKSQPPKHTYATKTAGLKPNDVKIHRKTYDNETEKMKVQPPTPEIPFTQITFDDEFHKLLRGPWEDTILIKVVGKPWFYPTLLAKLEIMWSLHGHFFELTDLGNNCYCLRGLTEDKRIMILTGGPWQLAGSFLSIRKWIPNFRSDKDKIESTVTWVRILNLPIELFRESVIHKFASCIGDPIKIDGNTFEAKKGRFARFCVEIETNKPLQLGLHICGKVYQVVYENLPSLCYGCGRVGHTLGECASNNPIIEPTVQSDVSTQSPQETCVEVPQDCDSSWLVEKAKKKEFGEWMIVERRKKKPGNDRNPKPNSGGKHRRNSANGPGVAEPRGPNFVTGPSSKDKSASDKPGSSKPKGPSGTTQGKRTLPKTLNQKGKGLAHSTSQVRILPRASNGISIKEPSTSLIECTNSFSLLPTDNQATETVPSISNGGADGDRSRGSGNKFPQRQHGGELDPKSGNQNSNSSIPRILKNPSHNEGGKSGECNDDSINSLGDRHILAHPIIGGQSKDGMAEVCLERLGAGETEHVSMGSSSPDSCDMEGVGY